MQQISKTLVAFVLLAVMGMSSCIEVKPHHRYYHKSHRHYWHKVY